MDTSWVHFPCTTMGTLSKSFDDCSALFSGHGGLVPNLRPPSRGSSVALLLFLCPPHPELPPCLVLLERKLHYLTMVHVPISSPRRSPLVIWNHGQFSTYLPLQHLATPPGKPLPANSAALTVTPTRDIYPHLHSGAPTMAPLHSPLIFSS